MLDCRLSVGLELLPLLKMAEDVVVGEVAVSSATLLAAALLSAAVSAGDVRFLNGPINGSDPGGGHKNGSTCRESHYDSKERERKEAEHTVSDNGSDKKHR